MCGRLAVFWRRFESPGVALAEQDVRRALFFKKTHLYRDGCYTAGVRHVSPWELVQAIFPAFHFRTPSSALMTNTRVVYKNTFLQMEEASTARFPRQMSEP